MAVSQFYLVIIYILSFILAELASFALLRLELFYKVLLGTQTRSFTFCFCAKIIEFGHTKKDLRAPQCLTYSLVPKRFPDLCSAGHPSILGGTRVGPRPLKSIQLFKKKKKKSLLKRLVPFLFILGGITPEVRGTFRVILISGFPLERSTTLPLREEERR